MRRTGVAFQMCLCHLNMHKINKIRNRLFDPAETLAREGIRLVASLLFGVCVCACFLDGAQGEEDMTGVFSRLKKIYDGQDYHRCVGECSQVIDGLRKNNDGENAPSTIVKNIYDLKASCQQLTGDDQGAIDTMRELVAYPSLTAEECANAEFRLGCVYERAGRLSKALAQFDAVKARYKKEFPDSYAKMARDKHVELLKHVSAVVSGGGNVPATERCSLVVFNGKEDAEGECGADGAFSVPLFFSTEKTMFALFALREGRRPFTLTRRYEGGGKVDLGEVSLPEALPNADNAFLCGVVFDFVSGGERVARRGITSFAKAVRVTARPVGGGDAHECVTGDDGVYTLEVPPGVYRVTFSAGSKTVEAAPGKTVILNFADKLHMVD